MHSPGLIDYESMFCSLAKRTISLWFNISVIEYKTYVGEMNTLGLRLCPRNDCAYFFALNLEPK